MLQPVQTRATVEVIADQIIDLIRNGYLKPGDKLPTEADLMQQLDVGRSSVREAKQILSAKGVISAQPGRGTFVRELKSDVVDGGLLRALLARETLLELQETRDLLEVQVVALATKRATEEDLVAMDQLLTRMAVVAPSAEMHRCSVEFHRRLAQSTHNSVLIQIYNVIEGLLTDYLQPLYAQYSDPEKEVIDHRRILDTVSERESTRAQELMAEHMAEVRRFLVFVMQNKLA